MKNYKVFVEYDVVAKDGEEALEKVENKLGDPTKSDDYTEIHYEELKK